MKAFLESTGKCNANVAVDCTKAFSNRPSQDKFIYTQEEREGVCQELNKFVSCFEATGCQWLDTVEPVYQGLKKSVNFTCAEENHHYEKVATCWEWNGFKEAQQFCFEKFGNRSEGLTCGDRNNMINCVIRSVDKCCGNETAVYAKKSAMLLLKPMFMMSHCDINLDEGVVTIETCTSMSTSSGPSIALIIVPIFVIIIIIVVVVVIVIIRKSGGGATQWASI